MKKKPDTQIRCAIYTRKSTEEGLDQEFNTLDAQRESGEAYIRSLKHEGWVCIEDRYDDGGYSGGNIERPALKKLLQDIENEKVDCVIVYKIDRFSRSLMDFSKMMEFMEKHGVSFVSVTQQFNTSTSMGRLMQNVLLSFAQFEREVISERTRDKIAATRRKGKWTGGVPILGYDISENRKLLINDFEAAQVKEIFNIYLERQSLAEAIKELEEKGWLTKSWVTKKGKERGKCNYTKNNLRRLLLNPLYIGKITYKDELFDGEHQAIIDLDTFKRANELLKQNGITGGKEVRNKYGALLKGLLKCKACNCGMVHSFSKKGNKQYRYYICHTAQSRGWKYCPSPSISAPDVESFVVEQIKIIGGDSALIREVYNESKSQAEERLTVLNSERNVLIKKLKMIKSDLGKARSKSNNEDQIVELNQKLMTIEQDLTKVNLEIQMVNKTKISEYEIESLCNNFEDLWNSLKPKEQARIIHLLIEQIEYDGKNESISISYLDSGIKELSQSMG